MNKFKCCISCYGWFPLHKLEPVSLGNEFEVLDRNLSSDNIREKERFTMRFYDIRVDMCEECIARAQMKG